jgi:hypothetical protein
LNRGLAPEPPFIPPVDDELCKPCENVEKPKKLALKKSNAPKHEKAVSKPFRANL